jgi:hypothetical protein
MADLSRRPDFKELYRGFSLPLGEIDCGERCGPFNDYGVPVCCDINILVPSAFKEEWSYLKASTDLWCPWHHPPGLAEEEMELDLQEGQVLLQCQGYQRCQREFRTITCRAFPFFPYRTAAGEFSGLAYYREFREQCWIISNLSQVSQAYKDQFRVTFQELFRLYPEIKEEYSDFSLYMREKSASMGEQLVLLDFSGAVQLIDPVNEKATSCHYHELEAFGPFQVTREMAFPDEKEAHGNGQ